MATIVAALPEKTQQNAALSTHPQKLTRRVVVVALA